MHTTRSLDGRRRLSASAASDHGGHVYLRRSPVNPSVVEDTTDKYATPPHARRTLLGRWFRMKAGRLRTYDGSEERHSPSSHRSTPTGRHVSNQDAFPDQPPPLPPRVRNVHAALPGGVARAISNSQRTSRGSMSMSSSSSSSSGGSARAKTHSLPTTRVLMEGMLVKLSSHKYWHAKPTYFVLVEEASASAMRSRIALRQYRKVEDARERDPRRALLLEIILSENDVIVDISDRYIKYGIELHHRANAENTVAVPTTGELYSLRLSASDSAAHHLWMRVLGSAIARLIDHSKRHYPITPADLEFAQEKTSLEPNAVKAIVSKAVPGRASDGLKRKVSSHELDSAFAAAFSRSAESSEAMSQDEPEQVAIFQNDDNRRARRQSRRETDDNNNNNNSDDEDGKSENNQHEDELEVTRLSNASISTPELSDDDGMPPPPPPGSPPAEPEVDDHLSVAMAASVLSPSTNTRNLRRRPPPPPPPPPVPAPVAPFLPTRTMMMMPRAQVHSFSANGQVFTLDVRYRLIKSIGTGAYGAVIAVKDSKDETNVAVKKITNIFDDLVDAKRILREVRLLRHFHHKNITQLLDLAPPLSKKHFEDMYIVTELMETDLHQVIYSMQPMSDDHVKYFLYQMLCALYHIHSAGVIHRDMKPSNILLNSNCDLKVCDFGLARGGISFDSRQRMDLTEYVVTRWYRAPEIMLNCLHYTTAIDVWAVGCIFAEMLLREPLFPGNDYIDQLKLIIKFLGTPKQEDIAFVKNVKALRFLTKLAISKPKKWLDVFTSDEINPLALDLLSKMLIFNPAKRITVEQALLHPYLATFYDPIDITFAQPFDFGFDLPDDKLTKDALVDLLLEDIAYFHPTVQYSMPPPPQSSSPGIARRYFGMTASAS